MRNNRTNNGNGKQKPNYIAKRQDGYGKNVSFTRVGAAWNREDNGSIYIKFHGTQIIDDPVYLFPVEDENNEQQ